MMFSKESLRFITPNTSDIVFLVILVVALTPICSYDVWWHLEAGEIIVETGAIPTSDPFSFTSEGKPWIAHEWLSEVIFYSLYSLGSFALLILMKALIVALSMFLIYKIMLKESHNPFISLILTPIITANISLIWTVRPHIFSLIFFAVYLFILLDFQKKPTRRIWVLTPLIIIWANLHGGFILGLLLVFTFLASFVVNAFFRKTKDSELQKAQAKTLFKVLILSTLVVLFNPNTLELLIYPLQYVGSNIHTSFIAEWKAPLIGAMPLLETLLGLIIFALAFSKKRKRSSDLLLISVFGFLAIDAYRSVPLFAFAAAPFLARQLPDAISSFAEAISKNRKALSSLRVIIQGYIQSRSPWLIGREKKNRYHTIAIIAVLIISFMFLQTDAEDNVRWTKYPTNASDYLSENNLSGNIFSLYRWGGYLIWNQHPNSKVFIDGRADVHGAQVLEDYAIIKSAGEDWGSKIEEYGVEFVLLDKESPLVYRLENNETWSLLLKDDTSILFMRQ
jgi:hypothetical protein